MPFTTAKTKLSDDQKLALDALLAEWDGASGLPKQAAVNLRAENGSAVEPLAKYLAVLADNRSNLCVAHPGPKRFFREIGKTFAFDGYEATPFKDAIFGRAMLLEKFSRCVAPKLDELKCVDTEDIIRDTLRSLNGTHEAVAPSRFAVYFKAMRRTPLGKGAVFATFLKPIVDKGPWEPPVPRADTIRSTIALGDDPAGHDYILFAYRLPAGAQPRVPTTASPGWSYQQWFRPNAAAATDLHGWTLPLNSTEPAWPEIVHQEIDGATVAFPIHIAAA